MRSPRGTPEPIPGMAPSLIVVVAVLMSAAVHIAAAVAFESRTSLSELSSQASQEFVSSKQSDLVLAISDAYNSELKRFRLSCGRLSTRHMNHTAQGSRNRRAAEVTESKYTGFNTTEFASPARDDFLSQFLAANKLKDLDTNKFFERIKALRNEEKSARGRTSSSPPPSISSSPGNSTNRSYPFLPDLAITSPSSVPALSTTSIAPATSPRSDELGDDVKSTTPEDILSEFLPPVTTDANVFEIENIPMDKIYNSSEMAGNVFAGGVNSDETASANSVTRSPRLPQSQQPAGSFFDQSHLNSLMEKLPPSDMEIERIRTIADESVQVRFPTSPNAADFWHSYTYNTGVFNRERLTVRGLSSSTASSSRPLSAVFQAPVAGSLLARDADGFLVAVGAGGSVRPLQPGSGWTESTVGCPCTEGSAGAPRSCACCRPGSCLCSRQDRCGPCPLKRGGPRCSDQEVLLSVDTVAALPSRRNETIIVVAQFDSLAVLETDGRVLSPLHQKVGQAARLSPNVTITSLTTLDVPTRQTCSVLRRTYILSHRASSGSLLAQEIIVDQQEKTYSLGVMYSLDVPGRKIKVLQTEERAFVFVQRISSVMVLELKAETSHVSLIHIMTTLNVSYPVMHLHCFENLGDSFLLVGGKDNATLYVIEDEKILQSQLLLPTHFGLETFDEILLLPSGNYRGDIALLATSGNNAVILTWRQRSFELTRSFHTPVVPWSSVAVLQTQDATEVVQVARNGRTDVIRVQLSLEEERDPLTEQNERLQRLVDGIRDRMTRHNDVLKEISSRLARSVTSSSTITGRIRMTGGVVVKSVRAQRLNLNRVTVSSASGPEQSLEQHQSLMRAEQQALAAVAARLNATDLQIQDGIPRNTELATLKGHITFSSLSIGQLSANDLLLNGRNLEALVQDLVDTNGVQFISGTTTFVSPLVTSSLSATTLDGIAVSDFVLETDDVTLGRVQYQNGITVLEEFSLSRGLTIGGIDLTRAMVVSGRNYLDRCTFSEVNVRNGLTTSDNLVNGIDIVQLRSSVLNRTHIAIIEGPLKFTNKISVEGSVYASTVMGVDVMNLYATSVYKNSASTIQSSVTFKSLIEFNSSVEVKGLVNGQNFPSQYPSASSTSIKLENKKFEEMAVQTMNVVGLVDGIRTQDLVTLSTDQSITGTKTFSAGIDVDGNLDISSGLLDGVNLIEIQREAGKMKKEVLTYNVIFEKKVVLNSLEVKGTVNNMDITEIAADLLLANEKLGKIFGTKAFAGNLSAKNVALKEINGVSFDDFVTSEKEFVLTGRKSFDNGFSCARLSVRGFTAGVNVTRLLGSSLYVNRPGQVVAAKKFFITTLRASRFTVGEDVNGVDFSKDVAIRTANPSFLYEQFFSSASFQDISVLHIELETSKRINKVDVSSLSESAVYLDKDQILYGSIACTGEITFKSTLKAKYVNDIDFEEFIHNLVQKDEENIIASDLQMTNVTVIGNLSTFDKEGINNFNISKLDMSAVKLDDEFLDLSAVWENVLLDEDVKLEGLLNGYDLVKLNQDAVFLDNSSPLEFSGRKILSGAVVITGNLSSPSINGLDLEVDVLTRSTVQIITAPYAFRTLITDDLHVGTFNGMNLNELIETRLGANMLLEGPVIFSEDISVDLLEVEGLVNDVSISGVMADVVTINGSADITGKKIFAKVPDFSSLEVRELHGEDLDALLQDLVRSDQDNHFSNDVTIASIAAARVVADTVTVQGLVDGVNSTELLADLIFLDRDQKIPDTGTLRFANLQIGDEVQKGDLLVQSLNSRDTHKGYLLADRPQDFDFPASFQKLTAGSVSVGGLVNGWDLDLFEQSLKVTGGQTLRGDVLFGSLHVTTSFNVSRTIGRGDGVRISSRDVIPLNQDPVIIQGCLKFSSSVRVRDVWSLSNVVNDVDLDDVASQAWRTDTDSFVSGNYTFAGPVYFESETTLGLHGLSFLATMQEEVDTIHHLVLKPMTNYREKYREQCKKGSVLLDLLSHGSKRPESLLEVFNVSLRGHALVPAPLVVQALDTILVFMPQASNSCSVAVHRWSGPIIGLQHWYNVEDVGEVADWTYLSGLPLTLVALAVKPSARCPGTTSLILNVTLGTIQVSQEIKGFGSVTWDRSNSSLLLHVGSRPRQTARHSYAWSKQRNAFTELPASSHDLVRFVSGPSQQVGWARLEDGVLRVGEDEATLAEVVVEDVFDADLLYQQNDLLLLLVTKQTVLDVVTYHLYALRQSAVTGAMLVQDWLPLPAAATVAALQQAAPGGEGSHLVALTTGSSEPRFYWLKGNGQLREWDVNLPARNVSWVGRFTSEGNLFLLQLDTNSILTISEIGETGQRLDSTGRSPVCDL